MTGQVLPCTQSDIEAHTGKFKHGVFPRIMGAVCTVNSTGHREVLLQQRSLSHISMAEQGGASGGFSPNSSWGKDLSDSARKRYLESMMKGIMEMGMEGQNSDIEIIVEGQSFPCHKILLAAGTFHKFPTFTLTILLCVALAAYITYVETYQSSKIQIKWRSREVLYVISIWYEIT